MHAKNFNTYSLDHFVRHQRVSECWRNVEGQWKLIPIEFERGRQAEATQSWQVYMDEHYDDAKMVRIYPNAKTK